MYSEEYLNFILRYDDRIGMYDYLNPECTTIVDNFFLIAYKNADEIDFSNLYNYGYNIIPKCYGLMDQSVLASIGVDRVRRLQGLSLTGKDTIVGFVDTGIDYASKLFRKGNGKTRIKAIWDQNEEALATGRMVYGFGGEYLEEDINEALAMDNPYERVPQKDEEGHGSFLASVSVGSVDVENDFSGIAPEADIVVVKLKQAKANLRDYYLINDEAYCFSEDDIILGIKYIVSKARELGKPVVICLGLGTNQGDHNGTLPLEWYIDAVCSVRGVSVVCAGGNEYGKNSHFTNDSWYADGSNGNSIELNVGGNDKGFCMEIWGNSPSLLSLNIISPTGERFNGISPQRNGKSTVEFLYEGSTVEVVNIVVEALTGDQILFMRFDKPAKGIWIIEINENLTNYIGGFDAWLPISNFLNSETFFLTPNGNVTLCSPANGKSIITVSGYNHYNNALYINSSKGYTRKNRIKPDFSAPSVDVMGLFAVNNNSSVLYTRRSGTSVGAAVTSGVISLIYEWAITKENNIGINNEIVKQMIIRGAKKLSNYEYPNTSFGWGNLDILGVFEAMRNA